MYCVFSYDKKEYHYYVYIACLKWNSLDDWIRSLYNWRLIFWLYQRKCVSSTLSNAISFTSNSLPMGVLQQNQSYLNIFWVSGTNVMISVALMSCLLWLWYCLCRLWCTCGCSLTSSLGSWSAHSTTTSVTTVPKFSATSASSSSTCCSSCTHLWPSPFCPVSRFLTLFLSQIKLTFK